MFNLFTLYFITPTFMSKNLINKYNLTLKTGFLGFLIGNGVECLVAPDDNVKCKILGAKPGIYSLKTTRVYIVPVRSTEIRLISYLKINVLTKNVLFYVQFFFWFDHNFLTTVIMDKKFSYRIGLVHNILGHFNSCTMVFIDIL